MKLAAFVLSTLSVLKAAAGASVIENAGQEAVLFKAFDKEDVVVGSRSRSRSARNTPEHTTCKQTCIAEECSDSSDGNRCKTECKKRCDSNTNYSDFSSSFSFDSPDENVFDKEDVVVGSRSRSRSRSARNTPEHTTCKQTCIAEECSDSSDGNRCKT